MNKKIYRIAAAAIIGGLIAFTLILGRKRIITVERQFPMMGTFVDFKITCAASRKSEAARVISDAADSIRDIENKLSPYIPESEISIINTKADQEPVKVSDLTFHVLKKSLMIAEMTDGAFDPSFAAAGDLWSLNPENPAIPSETELAEKMKLVDFRSVLLNNDNQTVALEKKGMRLDLGGIAKGTAIDKAVEVIRTSGFENALVNAGGDIFAAGKNAKGEKWKVAVLNPRDKDDFLAVIPVSDVAVVTSGDYERMVEIDGKRYHHILNTRTGKPAEKCISVTVVARDAETADALSTALFVLGPEEGIELVKKLPGTEALIVAPDGNLFYTGFFSEYLDVEKVNIPHF